MYIYIGSFSWPLLYDHIRYHNPVDITKSLTCEIIEQSSIFLQVNLSWFHICWSNLWWFHQCSASMLCHPLYYFFWNHHPWLEIYLKSLYGSVKIRGIKIWVIIWSDPLWLQKYKIFRGGVCSFSRTLFLATLVALHFTPVSKWVSRSFGLA